MKLLLSITQVLFDSNRQCTQTLTNKMGDNTNIYHFIDMNILKILRENKQTN